VADDRAERIVDLEIAPLEVDDRHPDRRVIERPSKLLLSGPERRLRRAPIGDVTQRGHHQQTLIGVHRGKRELHRNLASVLMAGG
jgi:hypothetical protein